MLKRETTRLQPADEAGERKAALARLPPPPLPGPPPPLPRSKNESSGFPPCCSTLNKKRALRGCVFLLYGGIEFARGQGPGWSGGGGRKNLLRPRVKKKPFGHKPKRWHLKIQKAPKFHQTNHKRLKCVFLLLSICFRARVRARLVRRCGGGNPPPPRISKNKNVRLPQPQVMASLNPKRTIMPPNLSHIVVQNTPKLQP